MGLPSTSASLRTAPAQGWNFTGAFQTDDKGASGNNISNEYAGGGLSCPTGTGLAYRFGRAIGPESLWGVNQYHCSPGTFSTQKMPMGGMFQQDDCGKYHVVNPMTGTLGCPEGFKPVQMGRIQAPESLCGAHQFVCKLY